MTRHEIVEEAAGVALSGMDPMRFLTSTDQVEVLVMQAVARRVHEIRAEENR